MLSSEVLVGDACVLGVLSPSQCNLQTYDHDNESDFKITVICNGKTNLHI
jgi:hypothetical protein